MRVFITVLVLIFSFQSWTKADDISDFQIEGMSIGDSALDYFSKQQIDNAKIATYNDDTYTTLEPDISKTENYDYISFSYKTSDKNYTVAAVSGVKNFDDSIKNCYKLQDKIFEEIQELFPSSEVFNARIINMLGDDKGTSRQTFVELIEGDFAAVQCYDYDKSVKRKDIMKVNLFSKAYNDWLINEAFK